MSSQVSGGPRQGLNLRQAETYERLLAAGEAELRAVGREALTVRTVAQRAGVSPATAYTYLASRNHLFAELFARLLTDNPAPEPTQGTAYERVRAVVHHFAALLHDAPQITAAVTPALLGDDPEVERLRLRIGAEFARRFAAALGDANEPDVLDALLLAFSGALLQVGMGLMTYPEFRDRLDAVTAVILKEAS
ncbi:TetR/AcrR family transcriptional regulator [Nocardioides alcanivorans]|uniref:TetR/AcrR family transcriptional regulator n=1 Tax=Nocardioides alcanivorans TaxID=2897352 RepID=UPI001F1A34CA|nr:TetR/AcrR family transcriptional regulator [Nocardioides alcanivorans]